ncbi:MAG TPA: hypothetical protein VMM13_13960, partial [Euzebya sp.]|nr:hypothetical protein [Euzebya sp.]
VAVQQNLGVANATMNDLNANRITIERVGHLLRGASAAAGVLDYTSAALVTALPDEVILYSVTGLDPAANPVQVQLVVEGTDMVERIWDPDPPLVADLARDESPTYPDPPRQRVIGRNVLSSAVFTYWTHSDDGTATGRCGRVLASPTGDDLELVDAISFRLQVQEPTGYESAASDLQGWARFASAVDVGVSTSPDSAGCLDAQGFGYQEVYASP